MKKIILSLLLLAIHIQAKDIYATFNVEADQSANLAFTSSGTVNSVLVDAVDVVKKGEVLAELENSDLKATLNIATVALRFAKKEYDRQLKVKKLVDASKFDSYLFKYENAKAQVIYQQALLDKTILKAPFDGVIYDKSVEVGDVVSGAMIRTILKIQSTSKRKLVLEFDQKYWKSIETGQIFTYSIDGDDKVYTGKITKVYPFANSNNRKIKAEVLAVGFTVGLFGDGHIQIAEKK